MEAEPVHNPWIAIPFRSIYTSTGTVLRRPGFLQVEALLKLGVPGIQVAPTRAATKL